MDTAHLSFFWSLKVNDAHPFLPFPPHPKRKEKREKEIPAGALMGPLRTFDLEIPIDGGQNTIQWAIFL